MDKSFEFSTDRHFESSNFSAFRRCWGNGNKLTLNVDKTKAMLIGSDSKLRKLNSLSVFVLGNQLDSVRSFKYLGVVLSSNFTWTEHVEHVISKVNQRLGLLRRIKHLLPYNARLLYYKSLVLPILDYADMVWGDKDNAVLMNNLQVLQNKAAKLVLDKPLYSSVTDALNQLGWLNLKQRWHFHRFLYVYKCVNGITSHKLNYLETAMYIGMLSKVCVPTYAIKYPSQRIGSCPN